MNTDASGFNCSWTEIGFPHDVKVVSIISRLEIIADMDHEVKP